MVVKILKYLFPCRPDANKEFDLEMPIGAEILRVAIKPYESYASIWTLVNILPKGINLMEKRSFLILGTGIEYDFSLDDYSRPLKYLNTIFEQRDDNPDECWVWHIFELVGRKV